MARGVLGGGGGGGGGQGGGVGLTGFQWSGQEGEQTHCTRPGVEERQERPGRQVTWGGEELRFI